MCFVMLVNEVAIGNTRSARIRKMEDVIIFITFIWSCTKFLIPKTNGLLLSYESKKAVRLSTVA